MKKGRLVAIQRIVDGVRRFWHYRDCCGCGHQATMKVVTMRGRTRYLCGGCLRGARFKEAEAFDSITPLSEPADSAH